MLADLRLRPKAVAKEIEAMLLVRKLRKDKHALDGVESMPKLLATLCAWRGRGTILANQDPDELTALIECLSNQPL